MKNPRIVFIGAEHIGLICLKQLIKLEKNIVGIFTADESLKNEIVDFIDFKKFINIEKYYYNEIKDIKQFFNIEKIKGLNPDLIFVISWSQIIPKEILDIPKLGCVGIHYSLLPERRGGAPLNWAIIEGEEKSGITLYYLDEGLDTGDIIDQQVIKIGKQDSINNILLKIRIFAPELIRQNIDKIESGTVKRIKQKGEHPTYTCRKPYQSELKEVQFEYSNLEQIHNFIRALDDPYPNVFIKFGNKIITFKKSRLKEHKITFEGEIK